MGYNISKLHITGKVDEKLSQILLKDVPLVDAQKKASESLFLNFRDFEEKVGLERQCLGTKIAYNSIQPV